MLPKCFNLCILLWAVLRPLPDTEEELRGGCGKSQEGMLVQFWWGCKLPTRLRRGRLLAI